MPICPSYDKIKAWQDDLIIKNDLQIEKVEPKLK